MIVETILGFAAAALGFTGAARVQFAKDRFESAAKEYQRITDGAELVRKSIEYRLAVIGKQVDEAMKHLKKANQILSPLQRSATSPKFAQAGPTDNPTLTILNRSSLVISDYSHLSSAQVGVGVGSAVAVGSWASVAMLGSASTGTAIAGLHGAALTNATLAWFGHGSLAAGGAGIAGGKLALAGIVLLPVAILAGFSAHFKADEIKEKVLELESINSHNQNSLTRLNSLLEDVCGVEPKLQKETAALSRAVAEANRKLFRFGALSRLRKALRYRFKGYYYSRRDMAFIDGLADAVNHFINTMNVSKVTTERSRPLLSSASAEQLNDRCPRCQTSVGNLNNKHCFSCGANW